MDRVQSNGGTAGIITAICLVALIILFASSGLDMQTAQDPAKALPVLGQKANTFATIGILGLLAVGFGLVFTLGLYARLRDKAPTRAAASLGFAFVGLTTRALGAALLWQGGAMVVGLASKDQTTAANTWIAMGAINQGLMATADAFTGTSALVAGWAIVATGVMSAALGWVAIIAGILEILQVFISQMALMAAGFLFVIVWLAWGGVQLRRA
jgi:hypothetical protein